MVVTRFVIQLGHESSYKPRDKVTSPLFVTCPVTSLIFLQCGVTRRCDGELGCAAAALACAA